MARLPLVDPLLLLVSHSNPNLSAFIIDQFQPDVELKFIFTSIQLELVIYLIQT